MVQHASNFCVVCGSEAHETMQCAANPYFVRYLGNSQRGGGEQHHSLSYYLSSRNHSKFSWGGNKNQYMSQGANHYLSQGAGKQYKTPSAPNRGDGQLGATPKHHE